MNIKPVAHCFFHGIGQRATIPENFSGIAGVLLCRGFVRGKQISGSGLYCSINKKFCDVDVEQIAVVGFFLLQKIFDLRVCIITYFNFPASRNVHC